MLWNEQAALLSAAAASGAASPQLSGDPNALAGGAIVLAVLILIFSLIPYFLCPSTMLLILSILLGWTGIGWVALFVYALFFCPTTPRCGDAHRVTRKADGKE